MDIEKVIRDYLPNIVHMSLGTSKDNKPWVCEVHFVYDENLNLYFRSLASRRHSQEIASNPQVAGNIIVQHPLGQPPRGIYFEGTARKLDNKADAQQAGEHFKARFGLGDEIITDALQPEGHQMYKITVDTYYVFGKLDNIGTKKHELTWNGGQK
jgi:uncharacterized protein YhbP (UPF0306 family)